VVGTCTWDTYKRFPDDITVKSSLQDFDLSRNTSLRSLQIPTTKLDAALQNGNGSQLLIYALSTVQPSVYFQVMVIYETSTFRGVDSRKKTKWPHLWGRSLSMKEAVEALEHRRRFGTLREVHEVRDFELVLCVNVWAPVEEYTTRRLKEAVAVAEAEKVFDQHFPAPQVTCNPRWDSRT
jgi:hypothetical protein